jgi:hypothetical protein
MFSLHIEPILPLGPKPNERPEEPTEDPVVPPAN